MRKKFLLPLLSIALVLGLVGEVNAQALLSPGVSANTFTAATGTGVAGTPYALTQGYSPTISWTITTVGGPSAITVSLQGSQDNLSWFDLDTSTNTAGEIRYLNPIALKFVRGFITTRTGGTNITISLLANRGFNNVASGGLLTTGISVPVSCATGLFGYSFNADLDTKICSDAANTIKVVTGGTTRGTWNSNGLTISSLTSGRIPFSSTGGLLVDNTSFTFNSGTTTLTVNGTTIAGGAVNPGSTGSLSFGPGSLITGVSDGIIKVTNNAGTDFSRLQFGGTTSSFPALKRVTTLLQSRLADDSAFAGFTAAYYSVNGAGQLSSNGDGIFSLADSAGTSFGRLQFGGTTSSFPAIKRSSTGIQIRLADDSADAPLDALTVRATNAAITIGSGTGITVNTAANIVDQVYKVTVDRTNFVANATTADVTIGTLPAKTKLTGFYADVTQTFACGSVCTSSTLSMTCGSAAGGNTILLTFDIDAATIQRGLADGDLGTDLTRATAVQGGKLYSWTATQIITCRLTSGTGNIGNGSATNLSQGSITFYVETTRLP